MTNPFQPEELDVLRHLTEPKFFHDLTFDIIDEKVGGLPRWAREAHLNGWQPPDRWYEKARKEIRSAVRSLVERGDICIDKWRLRRTQSITAMEVLAEQSASGGPQ